jgi:hypothetical protein
MLPDNIKGFKMKQKKAQSISINTIVVAAIALIVLVVMIAIFSGRIKIFTGGARDCSIQNGECAADCAIVSEKNGGTYINMPGTNCEDNKGTDAKKYCCVPIIKSNTPP